MIKYRIRNKTYTLVEELPNPDKDFVKSLKRIKDFKNNEYMLYETYKFTLYNSEGKFILETNSISTVKEK
jgi:hypothetical protein